MKVIELIVNCDEASLSNLMGEEPFQFLQRKFKEEFGKSFTVEELNNQELFEYKESTDGKAYKVRYLGDK